MGQLIWHEWARLISLTSSIYMVWSGIWALFYRKFFWDFVDGTLGPHGIIPGPNAAVFEAIIVQAPIVQIVAIILGLFTTALEWPLPLLKGSSLHRALSARIPLLLFNAFVAVLYYQGTNAAVYAFVAALVYTRAVWKGERVEEVTQLRGKVGVV